MSILRKYMTWRDEKMNGPRRRAEADARTRGASDTDVAKAGTKAERKRRIRASIGGWLP